MSPNIYQELVEALMEKGYDYDDTPGIIKRFNLMFDPGMITEIPDFMGDDEMADGGRVGLQQGGLSAFDELLKKLKEVIERNPDFYKSPGKDLEPLSPGYRKRFFVNPFEEKATGGRVGLQEGGEAEYDEILKTIMGSLPPADKQTITRGSPQVEALQAVLGPQIAKGLGTPISPTGGTTVTGETFGSFLPTVAPQTQAQKDAFELAKQQAMGGAGTGRAEGVAGFQPFLDDAATAAGDIGIAAAAGQSAGQTQLQNLADQANLAGLAAIAGQNVGQPGITAAQNIADRIEAAGLAGQQAAQPFLDRATRLAEPKAFEDFLSPYQEQVIDTTRQELERQLQAQQAQLGAGAGAAFGGGRFGIAQGELAARGAQGIAQTLAGLRQTGFEQARQAAANALQQQLALGQAAQGQVGQNLALLQPGLQAQLAGSQAAQQQAGQNVGLLGQTGQMQLGTAQGLQQQAAQNVGLNQAALGAQTGLAQLQPQLAAQNIGLLGQAGLQQQQQAQAIADATAAGQQMIAMAPQQNLAFFGSQITGLGGGYPNFSNVSTPGTQISPTMQALGTLGAVGGAIGGITSLFT